MRFTSRCASRRGREASPSAAIIDSQSAKTAQKGGLDGPARLRCGQEGHRPQAVDTLGLLLSVAVHPADIQDRDGAAFALNASTRALFPFIERIFADGGYQGGVPQRRAAATGKWIIEIVKRNELHKFVVLPKRWIVERTFPWITRNGRLAPDFERYATTVAAFIRLAMIRIMLRRLTRSTLVHESQLLGSALSEMEDVPMNSSSNSPTQ
jgi:transposase